jgi:hypothetical protein
MILAKVLVNLGKRTSDRPAKPKHVIPSNLRTKDTRGDVREAVVLRRSGNGPNLFNGYSDPTTPSFERTDSGDTSSARA